MTLASPKFQVLLPHSLGRSSRKWGHVAVAKMPKPGRGASSSHHSISIRPISNGFIMSQSHDGPEGYKSTETYHPSRPKVEFGPREASKRAQAKNPSNGLTGALRVLEHNPKPKRQAGTMAKPRTKI